MSERASSTSLLSFFLYFLRKPFAGSVILSQICECHLPFLKIDLGMSKNTEVKTHSPWEANALHFKKTNYFYFFFF